MYLESVRLYIPILSGITDVGNLVNNLKVNNLPSDFGIIILIIRKNSSIPTLGITKKSKAYFSSLELTLRFTQMMAANLTLMNTKIV
nr:hypothetical protein BCT18_18245 [Vibrio cyclitrophicus]